MREIYTTEAIILSNGSFREDGKRYLFLSPTLGLCFARAEGVRLLKSRLRYTLQDLSLVELDLVFTKSGWKITNARLEKSWYPIFSTNKNFLLKLGRVKNLLVRLTDGSFEMGEIFFLFKRVFDYCENSKFEEDEKKKKSLELYLGSEILKYLGYLDYQNWKPEILSRSDLNGEYLEAIFNNRVFVAGEINRAIKASQL